MAIHKNKLTIMNAKDISLSSKAMFYFHKKPKNINNFINLKKPLQLGEICVVTQKK